MAEFLQHKSQVNTHPVAAGGVPLRVMGADSKIYSSTRPGMGFDPFPSAHVALSKGSKHCGEISF
jgi:hypothetical protein